MPSFQCISCLYEKTLRIRPLYCNECGRTDTYCLLSNEEPTKRLGSICALDISVSELARDETGDSELDSLIGGGFVSPSTSTVFGRGGTGKSRSCIRWATHIGVTLLVSLEMPLELAVHSAKSARANLSKLYVTEDETDWQSEAAAIKAKCVVFDSFHYSQKQKVMKGSKTPLACYELASWSKANDGIVFMVCHSNKRNEVSGTTAVEHWPDYLFKFAKKGNNEATVTLPKSRYSPTGQCVITI
jgi:predicted ATP-dependent serine protease